MPAGPYLFFNALLTEKCDIFLNFDFPDFNFINALYGIRYQELVNTCTLKWYILFIVLDAAQEKYVKSNIFNHLPLKTLSLFLLSQKCQECNSLFRYIFGNISSLVCDIFLKFSGFKEHMKTYRNITISHICTCFYIDFLLK